MKSSIVDIPDESCSSESEHNQASKWNARRRSSEDSAMPARLWEAVVPTSEEAMLARRPLAVSVDDNIDLFGKIKKDATEPQFES